MSELRSCTSCKRHVRLAATACPFCASALAPVQSQFSRPRAFTRAAIFAAAVAGCSDHAHAPAAAGSAAAHGSAHGSDDLENLLDDQPKMAEHPAPPVDAAVDASEAVAATVDAGVDPQIAEKQRADARLRRQKQLEEKRRREQDQLKELNVQQLDHVQQAKPYGAPPARRRVV